MQGSNHPLSITDLSPEALASQARAVIFDFDGTLADSSGVWDRVDQIFFERRGLVFTDDYSEKLALLGFEEGARYTIQAYNLDETVESICAEWNELGRELYRDEVCLRPGAANYICALKQHGIPVALATTNDPAVLAAMDARVPICELFPVRVHGCQVEHHAKDHPDIYLEAARQMGVEPQRCLVFEDLLPAIITAHHAGMATVGVRTYSAHQNWELIQQAADMVIDGWENLL